MSAHGLHPVHARGCSVGKVIAARGPVAVYTRPLYCLYSEARGKFSLADIAGTDGRYAH